MKQEKARRFGRGLFDPAAVLIFERGIDRRVRFVYNNVVMKRCYGFGVSTWPGA